MSKKVIIHFLVSDKFSGAENIASMIVDNLRDSFDIYYCSPNNGVKQTLINRGFKGKFIEIEKADLKSCRKIIKDYKPDILHAHDFKATFLCALLKPENTKLISHVHIDKPQQKRLTLESILYFFTSYKVDKIIFVSSKILPNMFFNKAYKKKSMVIENVIDTKKIIELSQTYTVEKKYDLIFLGRLTEAKNPLEFINIVKEVSKIKSDIRAIMIGDGGLKQDCISLISKLNLDDNIQMLNFMDNPYPYLKASKTLIMPSKWEGFGLVAVEADIIGCKVLISDKLCLDESVIKNMIVCENINEFVYQILDNSELQNNSLNKGNHYTDLITEIYGEF